MRSSIEVNLAIAWNIVLNDGDQEISSLHDSVEKNIEWRQRERQASTLRAILIVVIDSFLLDGLSPWKQIRPCSASARQRTIPHSRKVRFTVRSAGSRPFRRLWSRQKQLADIC